MRPSSKWVTHVIISTLGAILIIINDLQQAGWEAPSWIAVAATGIAAIVAYWKAENHPPDSARATIRKELNGVP